MDDFEIACIHLLVRHGLLEHDVLEQLPFVSVADRFHDREERRTTFRVDPAAPLIIPRDASTVGVFEIAHIGRPVEVELTIADGVIRALSVDHPDADWPVAPQVLGYAEYPEP